MFGTPQTSIQSENISSKFGNRNLPHNNDESETNSSINVSRFKSTKFSSHNITRDPSRKSNVFHQTFNNVNSQSEFKSKFEDSFSKTQISVIKSRKKSSKSHQQSNNPVINTYHINEGVSIQGMRQKRLQNTAINSM